MWTELLAVRWVDIPESGFVIRQMTWPAEVFHKYQILYAKEVYMFEMTLVQMYRYAVINRVEYDRAY